MVKVSAKELRNNLREYLDRAEAGEEIIVLCRGKEVARIVPPQYDEDTDETSASPSQREPKRFPDLTELRNSIKLRGEPMSETVIRQRRESRTFPDLTEFRKLTRLPGESPLESLLKLREETR